MNPLSMTLSDWAVFNKMSQVEFETAIIGAVALLGKSTAEKNNEPAKVWNMTDNGKTIRVAVILEDNNDES